jgi:2-polyprenyl-3-methyl-5-hydroxy-6-metoxy-1,4-benzoquinol methylase
MLQQARQNGWNVFSLPQPAKLKMKFDLITLWDVIEHLPDPASVIGELKKLLSPKGRIVIQTPRFGLVGELFGSAWPHLLPVQHLSIASKEGMQKFVRRKGLTIEQHKSFGANAPGEVVPQPYKQSYDQLAKALDFGEVQILSLKRTL